jgi:hypothetical protein
MGLASGSVMFTTASVEKRIHWMLVLLRKRHISLDQKKYREAYRP